MLSRAHCVILVIDKPEMDLALTLDAWPLAKDRATTEQKEPGNRANLKAGQPVLTG